MKDYSVLLTCGETTMVIIHDAFDKGYQQGYEAGKADTPFTDTAKAQKILNVLQNMEHEPIECDDAISRDAVINTLDNMDKALDEDKTVENYKALLKECYEVLPSVTPKSETVTEFADRCRECGARYGELLKQKSGKWIPVSERLPEEREWIGTKRFGTTKSDEVYVTFECPDGKRFTEHLAFQNGRIPSYKQQEIEVISKGAVPIAWMPLPEPYKAESEE